MNERIPQAVQPNQPKQKIGGAERVEVEIFGEIYRLRTDDKAGLKEIVNLVDSTMKEIAKTTRSFASGRIAVMAALKLAQDCYQLRKDYNELLELLEENK